MYVYMRLFGLKQRYNHRTNTFSVQKYCTSLFINFSLTSLNSCLAVSYDVSSLAQVKDNFSDFSRNAVASRFKALQFDSNNLYLSLACSNYTETEHDDAKKHSWSRTANYSIKSQL